MLWDDSPNAGFSTGKPWLRIHQDYKTLNVKSQFGVPGSTFSYYQDLIKLRKNPEYFDTLTWGDFEEIVINDDVLAYKRIRQDHKQTIVVIANTAQSDLEYTLEDATASSKVLLSANQTSFDATSKKVVLGCGGAIVILL